MDYGEQEKADAKAAEKIRERDLLIAYLETLIAEFDATAADRDPPSWGGSSATLARLRRRLKPPCDPLV